MHLKSQLEWLWLDEFGLYRKNLIIMVVGNVIRLSSKISIFYKKFLKIHKKVVIFDNF